VDVDARVQMKYCDLPQRGKDRVTAAQVIGGLRESSVGADGWTWCEYDPHAGNVRAAWTAHYIRKGCSERKARQLADKKYYTWPPVAAK